MTDDDRHVMEPARGYTMTIFENDPDIDSNEVFAEFWQDTAFNIGNFQRGILCFRLRDHAWYNCDCKIIDEPIFALRRRFRDDKKFHDSILNELKKALDKLK